MLNIAHLMSRFRLADGGVVRAVLDMAGIMARQGANVRLITWDATDAPAEWKRGTPGLPEIIEIDPPSGPLGFPTRSQTRRFAEALTGVDVLHLHTPWEPANIPFARASLRAGVPYVLTVHGMLDDWCMAQKSFKKRIYLAIGARRMLERASAVHCTAQAELEQAQRWFPRGRGVVIPLVFDLEPFRNLPGAAPARNAIAAAKTDEPIILFLSRLHEKKRVDIVIDLAKQLRDDGLRAQLIIAGTGEPAYESALRAQVERADAGDYVHLVGLVTGEAKVSLFEQASVFVLPTSQENFGFVLIEAMAAGTPVITTEGVDIWPELKESGGAIIANADARTFAAEVAALLRDDARRTAMGERARAWVMKEFDGTALVRRFEQMYASAAGMTLAGEAEET